MENIVIDLDNVSFSYGTQTENCLKNINLKIKEVVRNEILKLLEAGIIYPISDSRWVSHVHCVPKKGGITVVPNDKNELIPQRIVTGYRMVIDFR